MSPRQIAKLLGSLGAVAVAAILAVTVVVVHYRNAGQKAGGSESPISPGTFLHAHNFHWTQMKGGASQWVLRATDASYANDRSSLTLIRPAISLTASDGKQVSITADSAMLNLDGNHITRANMKGSLVLHYGDIVLRTDTATFIPDTDDLKAPGPVTIQGPDLLITGIGLSGHPKAQTFSIERQVATRVTPRQAGTHAKAS